MNRRALFGAALALAALVLSVAFAFVPANFHRADISWQPTSAEDSGSLQLTRSSPERMDIETTCEMARTRTAEVPAMLTTGSIELFAVDDEVSFRATPGGPTAQLGLPAGECTIRATYTLDPSRLRLTVDGAEDEVAVDPPGIYGLYTTDPPSVSRVDLTTQETGLAPSEGRWLVGLAGLVALLAGLVCMQLTTPRREGTKRGWRRVLPRLAPVDAFVMVGVVGLSLVTPALIDDGWVVGRTRDLLGRWWFGNLYDTKDAWLPQGFPHELALALLQAAGLEFAQVRIVVALLVGLTWVVLRRGVLAPVLGEQASRWPAAAATYVAFAGAWLITVRAEPVVTFLAVLTLAVAVSAERCARPGMVFAGLMAAGLAVGSHQTGWVTLGPAVVILWSIFRTLRHDRTRLVGFVTAVLAAGAACALVTFAAADVSTALEGARTFSTATHTAGVLDELDRYGRLFTQASGARVFTVVLLLVWCLAGSLGINGATPEAKRLWVLCMVWLGGLLLTSSKWEWHLGVYAVPAAGLAALAGAELARRDKHAVLGTGAVLAMVAIGAGAALRVPSTWNGSELASSTWPELNELLVGDSTRKWWYLTLLILVVVGVLADRRARWRLAALTALCLVIVFPLGAAMAWIVADAVKPGWSPAGANLREVADRNECGALDGLDVDAGVTPLVEINSSGLGGNGDRDRTRGAQLAPEAFPHVERILTGPLGARVPTWGTWAADGDTSADARTGSFHTSAYKLGDAEAITIWSAFGSADLMSANVVFTSASGQETATPIAPNPEPHWGRLHVSVPDDAIEVRVDVQDDNAGYGGWLAVSSPVVQSGRSIPSLLRGSTGYASAFDATDYPCLELPDLGNGYWEKVDYVSTEGLVFNTATLRGLTVTDIACRPNVACLRRLDYPMANVEVSRTR